MIGMRIPRHITIPALIAVALLGGGAGCATSTPDPPSTQRPGVTDSPIPTPTATPSSYMLPRLATSSWRLGDDVSPLFALWQFGLRCRACQTAEATAESPEDGATICGCQGV